MNNRNIGYNDPWSEYESSPINRQVIDEHALTIDEYNKLVSELSRSLTDSPLGIR